MFGLGKHGPDGRYGAIIDIGSGSVGVAIVASDPLEANPEIIWTHRERMILRDIEDLSESAKHITAALLNSVLSLGSDGLKALNEHEPGAKITLIQVAISAPWSYTITKTVSYKQEQSFTITKKLVTDLVKTAEKQALEAIDANEIIKKLGLSIITKATINISANNYQAENVIGKSASRLDISHVSAISEERLLETLAEAKDKVLPDAVTEKYSFMLIFYCVLRNLAPDTSEVCLVDITSEATEIGIVRDGIIRYVTHAPFGTYTIARDIANLCAIPKEEALAYINGATDLESTLSDEKLAELKAIVMTYEDKITDLFKRTGDSLAIPRPLFIHTDKRSESFFKDRIKKAAQNATKSEHGIHLVTSKLLKDTQTDDSALLLSANFFHNLHGCDDFEQI